jgi:hypothetical protein
VGRDDHGRAPGSDENGGDVAAFSVSLTLDHGKFVPLSQSVVTNGTEVDTRNGEVEIATARRRGRQVLAVPRDHDSDADGEARPVPVQEGARGGGEAEDPQALGRRKGHVPDERPIPRRDDSRYQVLLQDGCGFTRTTVAVGTVNVRDDISKRTIIVRKSKSYTARPRR